MKGQQYPEGEIETSNMQLHMPTMTISVVRSLGKNNRKENDNGENQDSQTRSIVNSEWDERTRQKTGRQEI